MCASLAFFPNPYSPLLVGAMMTRHKSKRLWAAGLLLVLFLLGGCDGCTVISTDLEYDRMTGTTYPPDQTVAGTTYNLTVIFTGAGKLLIVDEDDTNIAALAGNFITEAELDALESANRSSPVSSTTTESAVKYYLYGIVVDHYYEYDDGTQSTGIMGIMWADDRRAFANFYKNSTISGDPGKFLRSAAHEVGHGFNMHHSDGDGSTTIMNQTGVVGNTYTYTFSLTSQGHLDDHPDECIYPGMGTFGDINLAHTSHGWTTTSCP